jgi:predicted RNA-binding Zn-ribbon protein involved in translation (DUF1610 family)
MNVNLSVSEIRTIISTLTVDVDTEPLIEKLETILENYKPRTIEELAEYYEVPVEKPCPKCGNGTMRLGTQVVDDEIPYPETGDFELAQTAIIEFECDQCGETEEVDTKTKGSGILR